MDYGLSWNDTTLIQHLQRAKNNPACKPLGRSPAYDIWAEYFGFIIRIFLLQKMYVVY